MNSNASISNSQMFIGFILFDYSGVHHFRIVKLYQVPKVEITDAKGQAVCEVIDHVVQHNHIPAEVETDNLVVSMTINGELNQKSDKKLGEDFWKTIGKCNALIKNKQIKVSWVTRELNRGALFSQSCANIKRSNNKEGVERFG